MLDRILPQLNILLISPIDEDGGQVHRYDVPGIHAVNFLLEKSLGGGGIASLRPDPLGKAFAQMLLSFELKDMPDLESLK